MRKSILGVVIGVGLIGCMGWSQTPSLATDILGRVPILHEGRIKPLETFARTHLLMFTGKSSLKDQNAMTWLTELLFDPDKAYERPLFRIRNSQVSAILKLENPPKPLYPFKEVSEAFRPIVDMVRSLHSRPKEERTPMQNQLIDLYLKVLRYYEISRSLTLIFPIDPPQSPAVAKALQLIPDTPLTYVQLIPKFRKIRDHLLALEHKKSKNFSPVEREWLMLAHQMEQFRSDARAILFRVVPPQWGQSEEWLSFWEIIEQSKGSPMSMQYLEDWRALLRAYRSQNSQTWNPAVSTLSATATQLSQSTLSPKLLRLEQGYNQVDPFTKSLACYLLAFLLIAASGIGMRRRLQTLSWILLWAGFSLHVLGITTRIIIMGRPPVSTLYESIVFVGAIVVLGGVILEWVKKNGLAILIASVAGALLHFIARGYTADGDTMGMLVAVLNTNFWLATHVVAITIGYGCSLVAGLLAHVYMVKRIWGPHPKKGLQELHNSTMGVALFALLFSLTGTILGGIWADQSWGRFWGWDPKENGAMLLVLWLITMIHGKISGLLGRDGFAVGMILTNIVVALAWFGVNLLSVGLHSYGFADNVALNLFLFCGIELALAGISYGWITFKAKGRRGVF